MTNSEKQASQEMQHPSQKAKEESFYQKPYRLTRLEVSELRKDFQESEARMWEKMQARAKKAN